MTLHFGMGSHSFFMVGAWPNLGDWVELGFFYHLACQTLVLRQGLNVSHNLAHCLKRLETPDLCGEFARYKKQEKTLDFAINVLVLVTFLMS